MTLELMLRLIAGVFFAGSVLLGMYVGANLAQSAFTNWCPMMSILRYVGVKEGRMARHA